MTNILPSQIAVIWDLDGTIVDSAEAHKAAWQQLGKETNTEFTDSYFWQTFGMRNPEVIRDLWGEALTEQEVSDIANRKEMLFRTMAREHISALPGAKERLQEFQRNCFKQAIASSGPIENITLMCRILEISDYFDTIVSGMHVQRGKPAPDIFLFAAQKLGILPERSVVIEDALAGVEAAKSAGMSCVAVSWDRNPEELRKADQVIVSLELLNSSSIFHLVSSYH